MGNELIGQLLGRYHILEQLGEGGMATVYKAFDTRLEAHVAVKVIRTEYIQPSVMEQSLKRFEREAKSLARLTHPNIVKVMDYGEHDGKPFLVMEYLLGGTLKERMKQGPLPWQEAVKLLIPVAQALGYAHKQNLIHRDVKSSNIIFTETGQPMLTDFGMAKVFDSEDTQELTNTGMGVGTPEYMAPEQWMGRVSVRSDIYSLGVVLYEMVTKKKPYTADTPAALLLKQANDPMPSPTQFTPDLPETVEKVLLKALAKEEKRYQNMGEFSNALENLLESLPRPSERFSRTSRLPQHIIRQDDSDATIVQGITRDEAEWISHKPSPIPRKKTWWMSGVGATGLVIVMGFLSWRILSPLIATPMPVLETSSPVLFSPLSLPIMTGTSIPFSNISISPQNVGHVIQLATWNKGIVNEVAFSTDGEMLAVASETGIYLYDTVTLEELRFIKTDTAISDIAISPDQQTLISVTINGVVQLWRIADSKLITTLEGYSYDVIFSPDGQTLATGMNDGNVRLWRVADGTFLRVLEGHTSYVFSVAFSPDGQTLASGSGDNTVRLWQVSDGTLLRVLEGHKNLVNTTAFSPDGQTLASGAVDNSVRLWNLVDGTLLRTYEGHISFVNSVDFSPDGQILASGAWDGTIKLWSIAESILLNTLEGHTGNVTSVDFSPNGQILASGSEDGTMRLWEIAP